MTTTTALLLTRITSRMVVCSGSMIIIILIVIMMVQDPPTKVQQLSQSKDNGGWIGCLLEDKQQIIIVLLNNININWCNGNSFVKSKIESSIVKHVLKWLQINKSLTKLSTFYNLYHGYTEVFLIAALTQQGRNRATKLVFRPSPLVTDRRFSFGKPVTN